MHVSYDYLLFFTFKVSGAFNQYGNLEFMLVTVLLLSAIFKVMDMLSASHINGFAGFTAKLMVMSVGKIRTECYLMNMVTFGNFYCFAGNGTETMGVAFPALGHRFYNTRYFMDVFLLAVIESIILIHKLAPFVLLQYHMLDRKKGEY